MDCVPVAEAGIALPTLEAATGDAVAACLSLRSHGRKGNGGFSCLLPESGRLGFGQFIQSLMSAFQTRDIEPD